MKFASGSRITRNETFYDVRHMRIVAQDGHTMFEISLGKDERSVEVRGVEVCKIDGILYSERLRIEPRVSNDVVIRTIEWKK